MTQFLHSEKIKQESNVAAIWRPGSSANFMRMRTPWHIIPYGSGRVEGTLGNFDCIVLLADLENCGCQKTCYEKGINKLEDILINPRTLFSRIILTSMLPSNHKVIKKLTAKTGVEYQQFSKINSMSDFKLKPLKYPESVTKVRRVMRFLLSTANQAPHENSIYSSLNDLADHVSLGEIRCAHQVFVMEVKDVLDTMQKCLEYLEPHIMIEYPNLYKQVYKYYGESFFDLTDQLLSKELFSTKETIWRENKINFCVQRLIINFLDVDSRFFKYFVTEN